MDVVTKLKLHYTITLISIGRSGTCEIVMWDRPRDSYFSIRLHRAAGTSDEIVAQEIEDQLRQRLAALHAGADSALDARRPSHTDRVHA